MTGVADALRQLDDDELRRLLVDRPDLSQPLPQSFAELASRASAPYSVVGAVGVLNRFERQVLDALAIVRRGVTPAQVAALAVEPIDTARIEAALERLRRLAVVHVGRDGYGVFPGVLRVLPAPAGLGRPIATCLQYHGIYDLAQLARAIGLTEGTHPRIGVTELRAAIATHHANMGSVRRLLAAAPAAADDVLLLVDQRMQQGMPMRAHELIDPSTDPYGDVQVGVYVDELDEFDDDELDEFDDEPAARDFSPAGIEALVKRAFDRLSPDAVADARARAARPAVLPPGEQAALLARARELSAAVTWLLQRALVLVNEHGTLEVPMEIGIALRGGRPIRAFAAVPPELAAATAPRAGVPTGGPLGAITLVARLLDVWSEQPPVLRKSGGLAQRDLKQAAKALDLPERATSVVIELARSAGLIDSDWASQRVVVTDTAAQWITESAPRRWVAIVDAWRCCAVELSALGRPDDRGRTVQPFDASATFGGESLWRRGQLVAQLAAATPTPGTANDPVALARRCEWFAPLRWRTWAAGAETLTIDVLDELALLGCTVGDRLTAAGAAVLLAGAGVEASRPELDVVRGEFPPPVTAFTVLSDLSVLLPAELDGLIAREIGALTVVEQRGAMTVARFTEASLRAGFDRGRTAAGVLAFLEEHAAKGVPATLDALVRDVGRRHGALRVGAGKTFVRSDDAALLMEVVRHRRLAKAGLRLLAPTVATSSMAPDKLLELLRGQGFLPMPEDEHGELVLGSPMPKPAAGRAQQHRRDAVTARAAAVWAAGVAAGFAQQGTAPGAGSPIPSTPSTPATRSTPTTPSTPRRGGRPRSGTTGAPGAAGLPVTPDPFADAVRRLRRT